MCICSCDISFDVNNCFALKPFALAAFMSGFETIFYFDVNHGFCRSVRFRCFSFNKMWLIVAYLVFAILISNWVGLTLFNTLCLLDIFLKSMANEKVPPWYIKSTISVHLSVCTQFGCTVHPTGAIQVKLLITAKVVIMMHKCWCYRGWQSLIHLKAKCLNIALVSI